MIDGKVWIERDGTEEGFGYDLHRGGIAAEDIVLAFLEPEDRPGPGIFTAYA